MMAVLMLCMLAAGSQIGAAAAVGGQDWAELEQNLSEAEETVMENVTDEQEASAIAHVREGSVAHLLNVGFSVAEIGAMYGYEWPWIGQYLATPAAMVGGVLPVLISINSLRNSL